MTARTRAAIEGLFAEAERGVVADLLQRECGRALPLTERWNEEDFERVWLAALKLSEGRVKTLQAQIRRAQADWRDVLVAAGFGRSLEAHRTWADSLKT